MQLDRHLEDETFYERIMERYISTSEETLSKDCEANCPFYRPYSFGIDAVKSFLGSDCSRKPKKNQELLAHQILFNIYEHGLVYLPASDKYSSRAQFKSFYDTSHIRDGRYILPSLEETLLRPPEDLLEGYNYVKSQDMLAQFEETIAASNEGNIGSLQEIKAAMNPMGALKLYLIQNAGDFLTEASGMLQNLGGNYGPVQSELFKVLIDEYGYGVHRTKHSTLFQDLLYSMKLEPDPHVYWSYYYGSSLAIHNFIHFLCSNHSNVFRYFGALYYAEATYAVACRKIASVIKDVAGNDAETQYFDEHAHIDEHHLTMVKEKILKPLLDKYGNAFNHEIALGFYEFEHYVSAADSEFCSRLRSIEETLDQVDELLFPSDSPLVPDLDTISLSSLQHERLGKFDVTLRETLISNATDGALSIVFSPDHSVDVPQDHMFMLPRDVHYGVFTKDI